MTEAEGLFESALLKDETGVLRLKGHESFGYSDGRESEIYLDRILRSAKDLSSGSHEIEGLAHDWVTEYHLTRKRAQLLSGFRFDRKLKVLEVGCGCGAITRHLGESFDEVVSVEGNIHRARIARLRTRDLDNVSIVCAPFQELEFAQKFDLVVCVGVYEYSGSFISGADPYEDALAYFSDILSDDGQIIIAIENQFGLKYFSSSREDHVGVMFEGIEGYRRYPTTVKTFGRVELERNVKRHFKDVKFYYPYPDYKIPDMVISESFLISGLAGELISHSESRDYHGRRMPLFDERAAVSELNRNAMLPFFSNSFLLVAGKNKLSGIDFDQEAVLYSPARQRGFCTKTRVVINGNSTVAIKSPVQQNARLDKTAKFRLAPCESAWQNRPSLQAELYKRIFDKSVAYNQIFSLATPWKNKLESASIEVDGRRFVTGGMIDFIFPNIFIEDGDVTAIDQEFVFDEAISVNAMVLRAIYHFVLKYETELRQERGHFLSPPAWYQIKSAASALGVKLTLRDIKEFMTLEAHLLKEVYGQAEGKTKAAITLFLALTSTMRVFRKCHAFSKKVMLFAAARLSAGA